MLGGLKAMVNVGVMIFIAAGGMFSYKYWKMDQDMQAGVVSYDASSDQTDPWEGIVKVENARTSSGYLKPAYVALARHDAPDGTRVASITHFATLKELLKGEKRPSDDALPAVLAAKASEAAAAECKLLLETVAKECKVVRTADPRLGKDTDYYQISFDLAFSEKAALGKFDQSRTWVFKDGTFAKLDGEDFSKGETVSPPDQKLVRKSLYKELARACSDLRRSSRPCELSQIIVRANIAPNSSRISVYGSGMIASLAPAT